MSDGIYTAPGEEQKTSLDAYRQLQRERREFEERAEARRLAAEKSQDEENGFSQSEHVEEPS
jgi:hypothetical protein